MSWWKLGDSVEAVAGGGGLPDQVRGGILDLDRGPRQDSAAAVGNSAMKGTVDRLRRGAPAQEADGREEKNCANHKVPDESPAVHRISSPLFC